jgi:hypothetical protein
MRRYLLAGSLLAALIITIGVLAVQADTEAGNGERATVEFTDTVKLKGVFLKGQYLIVHDDEKMAKGEDCSYFYDRSGRLVVSFHCIPVERPKTKSFRIVTVRLSGGNAPADIVEIQFPGSTEAHQVP